MELREIVLDGVEEWREYAWTDPVSMERVTYRVSAPSCVVVGRTTHRVVDTEGVTHIVPAVGWFGCVVRFKGQVVA